MEINFEKLLKFAPNFKVENNTLIQSGAYGGKTMSLLDIPFKEIDGNVKVKLVKVKKNCKVIVGLITK